MQRILERTTGGVFAYRTRAGRRWGVDFRDPTTGRRRRKRAFRSQDLALRYKDKMERQRLGSMASLRRCDRAEGIGTGMSGGRRHRCILRARLPTVNPAMGSCGALC